ncbi:LexA family protein, partial [Desulfobulbus alkaliphilus]|uniref:LexA family protein n=1 Tax=Desulfobulbus alkaliphilus TaxID=869814 RepID=UPI0019629268
YLVGESWLFSFLIEFNGFFSKGCIAMARLRFQHLSFMLRCDLDLNELLVTNPPATFFVRVDGDSMIDAGIHHGDILSVDRSEEACDGSVVIAMVNGEMTVKQLSLYPKLRLIAHNEKYQPIELNEHDDFEIFGRVKGLVRVFK